MPRGGQPSARRRSAAWSAAEAGPGVPSRIGKPSTPTIGISKKLLCGSVDLEGLSAGQTREVVHEQQPIGAALKARPGSRPFFASPGHRVDLQDAIAVVQQVLGSGRLPVPIALADRMSRDEARRIKEAAAAS